VPDYEDWYKLASMPATGGMPLMDIAQSQRRRGDGIE
jgi:hypothetical protein